MRTFLTWIQEHATRLERWFHRPKAVRWRVHQGGGVTNSKTKATQLEVHDGGRKR